jgi:hypothetical protein
MSYFMLIETYSSTDLGYLGDLSPSDGTGNKTLSTSFPSVPHRLAVIWLPGELPGEAPVGPTTFGSSCLFFTRQNS